MYDRGGDSHPTSLRRLAFRASLILRCLLDSCSHLFPLSRLSLALAQFIFLFDSFIVQIVAISVCTQTLNDSGVSLPTGRYEERTQKKQLKQEP